MTGFKQSIERIEPGSGLIALDYQRISPRIKMPPYFQMFAYAQLWKGADLNWSFAGSPTSLVVFKENYGQKPWTEKLDWHPGRVRQSDFRYFDYALFHGGPEIQARRAGEVPLEPWTGPADWRLYRVGDRTNGSP
jgi:hypothetical protein